MPFEVKFENLPAGICVEAVRGGGTAKIRAVEFISEVDGDVLIERLEAFGSQILGMLPVSPPIQPSQVQHLLAVIRRDRTATVYIIELNTRGLVQVKKELTQGDFVFADDIADVHRLEFESVTIPNDTGIIYIFAVGWRRAIFYDLAPLLPKDGEDRECDVATALAKFYTYLMFQRRLKIADQTWQNLFDGQWFPFVTLKESTIHKLIAHAANAWPLDDLAEAIAGEVKDGLPTMLARWKGTPAFVDHAKFLEQASERYLARDSHSATVLLYSRIEGLLRSHQKLTDPGGEATQKGLSGSAVKTAEAERHPNTPLLPGRFRQYPESVYFASFNPDDLHIKVSRNSKLDHKGKTTAKIWDVTDEKSRNIVWKTRLPGWSLANPVVVGDRVFAVGEPDWLTCLDANSGKVLWQTRLRPLLCDGRTKDALHQGAVKPSP